MELPELGMTNAVAQIVEWLVAVGDEVSLGSVVAVVETDKVEVEIDAAVAGRVAWLCPVGQEVEVGEPILSVEVDGSGR